MKIRVLHVIDHLGYGGAPFVVKGIVERMPADRIESIVCALRPNRKSLPIDAQVITLKGHKYSPAAIFSIAHLCRKHRIDILHAHLQKAVIGSLLATYLCSSRLIVHEHGPIFRRGAGGIYRRLLRLLGGRADMIFANSEAAKAAVQQTMRTADVPLAVIPNFVDLQQFDPDRYDRTSVRESLGLDPAKCVIGFVGRLDPAKGADVLVEAAALLRSEEDAYRFLVVGDGPERDRLDALIQKLDVGRMVILAGLRENPAAIMRAFDVGVVPSRREAFGIAALELMRMRVPVVAAPVGGLLELVQDGRTGITLPELSPAAIAQAIRRLRDDPALREQLGREGHEHAGRYDGRRTVRQIVEVYERLMSARQREHTRGT